MNDKLKVKTYHIDAQTGVETELEAVLEFDYECGENQDIEFEVVHDANGNIFVRPKKHPKY